MTITEAVEHVQFCYPQVYYACHTRHQRGRTADGRLSPRDSQILVHLDPHCAKSLTPLARHLGLAARLRAILRRLSHRDLASAMNGLRRLAEACGP